MHLHWKKIVVPIDFSASTDATIALAADLAHRFDGKLYLLYVLGAGSSSDRGVPSDPLLAAPDAAQVEPVKARMAALATEHGVHAAELAVREGDPATEIHFYAGAIGADLIVIAPHSHGTIHRLLLGSVASDVVRMAERPVLVVAPPPQ